MINVYNAPSSAESERQNPIQFIVSLMATEYGKENYVMTGGNEDITPLIPFGCLLYYFRYGFFYSNAFLLEFIPSKWKICFGPTPPTMRSMRVPYQIDSTPVAITDFFIVSPNIRVLKTKTIPFNFKYSQHNPVVIAFKYNI